MADEYGVRGGLVSPRVHLPVRSQRSPAASPPEPVTLQQPRPDVQRVVNEYVETPLRPVCESGSAEKDRPTSVRTTSVPRRHKRERVVTEQPGAGQTFKKDSAGPSVAECSIICRECGRCRCEACRRPRPMPSLWLCHDFCLCSAESCVDYGSCLCCVKGLMYHCASRDGDDDTCADQPCSCGPERRVGRWLCLGLTSLLLPCLCCYWPLRGLASAAEACYGHCTDRGCRCDSPLTPEKRLLHSSPRL